MIIWIKKKATVSKYNREITKLDWWTARGYMHRDFKKEWEEKKRRVFKKMEEN